MKKVALPELLWFDQLLGQGPTYALHVGWALAQDHCKYPEIPAEQKKKRHIERIEVCVS